MTPQAQQQRALCEVGNTEGRPALVWGGAGHAGEVHLGHIKYRLQEESWMIMCGSQRKPGLWERGARTQDRDGGTSTGGLKGAELERRLRTTTRGVGKLQEQGVREALGESVSKRKSWPVVRCY